MDKVLCGFAIIAWMMVFCVCVFVLVPEGNLIYLFGLFASGIALTLCIQRMPAKEGDEQ